MRKIETKAALVFLIAGSFLFAFSILPTSKGINAFSRMPPFSVALQPIDLNVILAVIALLAVFIGVGVALVLRKHFKIVTASVLAVVIVIACVGAIWYNEASINYWIVAPYSTQTGDNSLTIFCENIGHLQGTFDLKLSFLNAHFSSKTSLPFQVVDNQTVEFTFTLQPGEKQSRQAEFIVDQNISDFYVNLSFQQNDGNLLVKTGFGGVSSVSYQKDVTDYNFTMRTFYPPP